MPMTAAKSLPIKALLAASLWAAGLAAPAFAQTAEAPAAADEAAAPQDPSQMGSVFACQDGHQMKILFQTRNADLHAIVDTGAGPHDLVLKPWKVGDDPEITWTDGVRTLTWSAGVQLMFMDGSQHVMCGGGMHHH